MTELEDLVVDLNKRVQQLTLDNAQLEHRVGELSEQHSQRGDSGQLGSDATVCATCCFGCQTLSCCA